MRHVFNRSTVRACAASVRLRLPQTRQITGTTRRGYHTYPDPDETPVVSNAKSEVERTLSKAGEEYDAMKRYDMDKPFDLPDGIRSVPFTKQPKTEMTTLANGLTIATHDMPGLMCSVALLVKTGSTAELQDGSEDKDNTGVVHTLELTAFGDTPTMSREEVHGSIEKLGGIVQCVAQRESITFFMDVFKNKVDESLDILSESVLNASLSEEEIDSGKADLQFQRETLPPEFLSKDAVVMAAYHGQPLGNSHYCPENKIEKLTRQKVLDFKSKYFVPENCIISASAVEHESFVKKVEKAFAGFSVDARAGASTSVQPSTYTGGMVVDQRTLREEFVRCTVAFEVGGWNSDQFVASCVLQTLLGGGSSFSAGGPGKGMYTRLYREILNRYGWVESAEAFISCHRDVGLLGIDGSCRADGIGPVIQVFLDQLIQVTVHEVTDVELSRAKNMLKSMMFMQLESRLITCEDIAKQLLVYGERRDTATLCRQIDAITAADILKLARSMLKYDPAVAVVGHDVSGAPSYEAIKQFTNAYKAEVWGKHKITIE